MCFICFMVKNFRNKRQESAGRAFGVSLIVVETIPRFSWLSVIANT